MKRSMVTASIINALNALPFDISLKNSRYSRKKSYLCIRKTTKHVYIYCCSLTKTTTECYFDILMPNRKDNK